VDGIEEDERACHECTVSYVMHFVSQPSGYNEEETDDFHLQED
jgi:hypothetical protein